VIARLIRPLALIAAFAVNGASAQGFSDGRTGFSINPPAPYYAEASRRRQFDVGASIQSRTGFPPIAGNSGAVCDAGFKATSANAGMSPAELQAVVESSEWRELVRRPISTVFLIQSESLFTSEGYRGIEFTLVPKAGPDAAGTRLALSMVETARGRVTIVCGTSNTAFEQVRNDFRAIRSSMTLPK
jgi:hypothetical protein